MCTVTWWRDAGVDAFGVWFNRDERRTRPASEPVRPQHTDDGTAYLAPRDPAAGGTWLLANAHGLVVGVLNYYAATATTTGAFSPAHSRGTVPLRFADCGSVAEVARDAAVLDCGRFAPFILVAWDREQMASWAWDGAALEHDTQSTAPLTTSSFRSEDVCAWRRARYAALVAHPTPEMLAAYHDDVAHADPAFNIRMRRPDARTESMCRVLVTRAEVRLLHRRESADTLAALDVHEATLKRIQ